MHSLKVAIAFLCWVLIMGGSSFAIVDECRKIDEFGDMWCEDEQARLDNYGVQLYEAPQSQGYIIYYEGKYWEALDASGDCVLPKFVTASQLTIGTPP